MAEQPVRLRYGSSLTFSPGGGVTGVKSSQFTVSVENISYVKDVALRYAQDSGVFTEKALAFSAPSFGNYDIFTLSDSTFSTTRFAVRYTVDGQTFWDNNNGADYQVNTGFPNTVGGNVALSSANARIGSEAGGGFVFTTSWLDGQIFVKNLSFNKRVGVRWTSNNWASFQDTLGTFGGTVPVATGLSEVETWNFKTPEFNLDTTVSNVFEFVVFYNNLDTGEFFWDNNFGQNYTLSKR